MATGILRVSTFDARFSAPAPNITVVVVGENFSTTIITDSQGLAPDIPIEAPDKSYSLDENNTTVVPWSQVTVTALGAGYQPQQINGVEIFDGQVTLAQLEMTPLQLQRAAAAQLETVDIPPIGLFSGNGGSGISPDLDQLEPTGRVLREVIIPKNITVHLGAPNSSAQNVTVSFRSYIANVASSEVYPTWPEQALRANIHAQISLALNRIFTEWYPSRGYTFNITSSPGYDQAYVRGRTIFEVMQRLTDEIFNTYLRRAGTVEPYFAEYCDGKTVSCAGMKQWGTLDRANQGQSALQILRYYYGSSIEIVESNNIQSIPASYPGTALRRGSTGANVRVLQNQLNRIARDYPAFGTLTVDGIFGPAMEATVKRFQRQFSLTQDGIVGKKTWYKISYIYVSVTDLAQLTSEGIAQTGTIPYPGTLLRRGSTGANVSQVQRWLNGVAGVTSGVNTLVVDGKFGAATEADVRAFQSAYGLTRDGIVGRTTWTRLNQAYLTANAGVALALAEAPQLPLQLDSEGEDVGALTQRLDLVAFYYPTVPSYGYTTFYDRLVEEAVTAYQRQFDLPQTGVVDRETWDSLDLLYFQLLESANQEEEG